MLTLCSFYSVTAPAATPWPGAEPNVPTLPQHHTVGTDAGIQAVHVVLRSGRTLEAPAVGGMWHLRHRRRSLSTFSPATRPLTERALVSLPGSPTTSAPNSPACDYCPNAASSTCAPSPASTPTQLRSTLLRNCVGTWIRTTSASANATSKIPFIGRLAHFLSDFGARFSSVGRQYQLSLGNSDFYLEAGRGPSLTAFAGRTAAVCSAVRTR